MAKASRIRKDGQLDRRFTSTSGCALLFLILLGVVGGVILLISAGYSHILEMGYTEQFGGYINDLYKSGQLEIGGYILLGIFVLAVILKVLSKKIYFVFMRTVGSIFGSAIITCGFYFFGVLEKNFKLAERNIDEFWIIIPLFIIFFIISYFTLIQIEKEEKEEKDKDGVTYADKSEAHRKGDE